MKAIRRNRLMVIMVLLSSVLSAVFFVMKALQSNIDLYLTPTQLLSSGLEKSKDKKSKLSITPDTRIRIGGMVEKGSLKRGDNLDVQFTITDFSHSLIVQYSGILPDLFREGQGIVALGSLGENKIFYATEVLAKHDENYMPPGITNKKNQKEANIVSNTNAAFGKQP